MLCSPEMRPQTPGAVGLRPAGAPSVWEREGVAISAEGGQEDGAGWGGASHRLACFSPHPVFTSQLHRRRRKCVTIHMFFCPEKFLFLAGF